MKKLLILLVIFAPALVFAQANPMGASKEDVELVQSIYGKEKRQIQTDFLKLDDAKKAAFWKLYDEYEVKRKELGKRRVALLENYITNFEKLDDAKTKEIITETASLGAATDKLVLQYFKKMQKEVGAKPAAQFYQLELYFLSAIRLAIFENIPFIADLK
jgi:hypothetical protein